MRRRGTLIFSALTLLVTPAFGFEFSDIYYFFTPDAAHVTNTGLSIFPTLVIPSGGEFEAMGQAYTAVARDASFFDANAAGSSTLEYTELTLVHNNWISDSSIEGVLYTRRIGDLGLAVGGKFLHVDFTEYDTLTHQASGGLYSEGSVGANVSYNFLRSYDFPGIAVGTTLKAVYREIPDVIAPDQSAVDFAADVGVLTRFNVLPLVSSRAPNFALGLAARNIGPGVRGEPLPSEATAGFSYAPIPQITVASDLIYPFSLVPGVDAPPLGAAFGLSVRVTDFFTAQTGLLLRWTGFRYSMGATIDLADISIDVNWNLDLLTQLSSLDRFSVQARLNFGDEGRGALRDLVDQYYLEAWKASVAGNIDRAIEYSQKALELDSGFTPAQELLSVSQDTQRLQADLRAIDLESIGRQSGDATGTGQ